MKRNLFLLLIVCLIFSLTSCQSFLEFFGAGSDNADSSPTPEPSSSSSPNPTASPEPSASASNTGTPSTSSTPEYSGPEETTLSYHQSTAGLSYLFVEDFESYTEGVFDESDWILNSDTGFRMNEALDGTINDGAVRQPLIESSVAGADGKVLRLCDGILYNENTLELRYTINISETAVLGFDYCTDISSDLPQNFNFYIDNVLQDSWKGFAPGQWKKAAYLLNPGTYSLKWALEGSNGHVYFNHLNTVWIDNLSLVPDQVEKIELVPHCFLEIVKGQAMELKAKALRLDGSIKDDALINLDIISDGGAASIDSSGLLSANEAGFVQLRAEYSSSIYTASEPIYIYPADYRRFPFNYAGTLYNGIDKNSLSGDSPETTTDELLHVSYPTQNTMKADAFITIEGNVSYTDEFQYALIEIAKDGADTNDYPPARYYVSGNFNQRVWLRYGAGDYTVTVNRMEITIGNTIDEPYDGAIKAYSFSKRYEFHVTNTNTEDGTWFYPSDKVQSDNLSIRNFSRAITKEPATDQELTRKIHDWVVLHVSYDDDSLDEGKRKKMDAVSTLERGSAVCEGYSHLFAALMRANSFHTRYVSGDSPLGPHAWNHVKLDGTWYFVDTTWDDSGENLSDTYFLLTTMDGIDGDHTELDLHPERMQIPLFP